MMSYSGKMDTNHQDLVSSRKYIQDSIAATTCNTQEESIYEQINPRLSNTSSYGTINCTTTSFYANKDNYSQMSDEPRFFNPMSKGYQQRMKCADEFNHLDNLLNFSMAYNSEDLEEPQIIGVCHKCCETVFNDGTGCTSMNQVYHIKCFTCYICDRELQGASFYYIGGQPYCENDYLDTLEKCSVCNKPTLDRILRATGKPFHPDCFTCVVCGKCLDGIPFTVDSTNKIYCIDDFHRKFAPRCSICKEPIISKHGQENAVRVVALDRSFHIECYKCEDCGIILSSKVEGRGCYPLDDHVLCRDCNAKRIRELTAQS